MKAKYALLFVLPLLASCASQPLTLQTVGPSPFSQSVAFASDSPGAGELQVFTETEEYNDDDLAYFPHTDYQIYSEDGKRLRRVWNHLNHEDEDPASVTLKPGQYRVKAWAEFYGLVTVPVVVKANRKTMVVLQPGWKPGAKIPDEKLVRMPNGYFVGWRATSPPEDPSDLQRTRNELKLKGPFVAIRYPNP